MTELLHITLEAVQPGEDWHHDFLRRAVDRCPRPLERASELRLVTRREWYGLSVEPFLGSASFAALLGVRRRVSAVIGGVEALVAEGFRYAEAVGILVRSENDEAHEVGVVKAGLDEALRDLAARQNTWFKLCPPLRIFRIAHVEARLYKPLELETGDVATHYFRDFRVVAEDAKRAKELIVADLAKDGAALVKWGPADVIEVGETNSNPSIVERSGRVYFTS